MRKITAKTKRLAVVCSALLAVNGVLFSGSVSSAARMYTQASGKLQNSYVQGDSASVSSDAIDMSKLLDMNELYGWAAVAGQGQKGVTGGGNEEPCVVKTMEELEAVILDNTPRVIVISGTIRCGGYGVLVGNNKTIVGIDKNATLYGGFRIHNSNNIIISNLNIQGTWPNGGPDDCLEVKGSHHLWFNHLNIWDSTDGNVDITLGSDYVTVSWCKMWYSPQAADGIAPEQNHRLSCLVGSGAGDHDDTDMGKLRVSYHHNWFSSLLFERMPRVMYGRTHVYNNYYSCENNNYCIGADSYASVLIENNYFKNVKNPHEFSYNSAFPTSITARGNIYDNTTGKQETGQHSDNTYAEPFDTTEYDYFLNSGQDVPEIVQAYAGPQDMSDEQAVPEKLANGTLVKKAEKVEDTPKPFVNPLPTLKPTNQNNDNPITYDEQSKTFTYHGQNANRSNAYYTIYNPFKNKDFSEKPSFSGGYPVWTKGVTISYWVKVPSGAVDASIMTFNLENKRQIERNDAVKYRMCQNYSESDASYRLGTSKIFVDATGNEYKVLTDFGENVLYNPEYPAEGCYSLSTEGGAVKAYEKGSNSDDLSNWSYLNYIGEGVYENFGKRFDEAGGENSKIREAKISGSLCLYASGSMGYRQDNWNGLQMNPYLNSYGKILDVAQFNQFYYWGNGGYKNIAGGLDTPTMKEKDTWHFVVCVIQNDWIAFYMDGIEMDVDYLSWWNQDINMNTAGTSFNLGYGHKKVYRTKNPSEADSMGMTILDFISDEETVLTIGGMGAGATKLSQNDAGTPANTQVKDVNFYFTPIAADCIRTDRIVTDPKEPDPTETPIPSTTSKPTNQPVVNFEAGDVDGNHSVNLADAQLVLKRALGIIDDNSLHGGTADMDKNGKVDLVDAQYVLKRALGIL